MLRRCGPPRFARGDGQPKQWHHPQAARDDADVRTAQPGRGTM